MKKRIDPATLSDDQLVDRWKTWLKHTRREADEFYSFRFKVENVNKMFVDNKELQTPGGGSTFNWLVELHKTYCLTSIRRELEGGPHQNLISFLYEVEKFSEKVFTRKRFVALYSPRFISRYPEPQYNWLQPFTIPWTSYDFKPWEKPDEPDELK